MELSETEAIAAYIKSTSFNDLNHEKDSSVILQDTVNTIST